MIDGRLRCTVEHGRQQADAGITKKIRLAVHHQQHATEARDGRGQRHHIAEKRMADLTFRHIATSASLNRSARCVRQSAVQGGGELRRTRIVAPFGTSTALGSIGADVPAGSQPVERGADPAGQSGDRRYAARILSSCRSRPRRNRRQAKKIEAAAPSATRSRWWAEVAWRAWREGREVLLWPGHRDGQDDEQGECGDLGGRTAGAPDRPGAFMQMPMIRRGSTSPTR